MRFLVSIGYYIVKILKCAFFISAIALSFAYISSFGALENIASNETYSKKFFALKDKTYCLRRDMVIIESPSGSGYHDKFDKYRMRVKDGDFQFHLKSGRFKIWSLVQAGTKITFRESWQYIDNDIEMRAGTFDFLIEVHHSSSNEYGALVNAPLLVSGNRHSDPFIISEELLGNC